MTSLVAVSCLLLLTAHQGAVHAQGTVSANAVAFSYGGDASATSRAKSDGEGSARSTVVSITDRNSNAHGVGIAESRNGADASSTLLTRATDGATVDAKAFAYGEEKGAQAIVDSIAEAKGGLVLESVAVSEAINRGDGALINRVLERAYADSAVLGDKVSKVIKATIVKAISQKTGGVEVVSTAFRRALTSNPIQATKLSDILSSIVRERGCPYLKPYLTRVQAGAIREGTDDALVSAIHENKALTRCTYPPCGDMEFCCATSMVDMHLCQMCPITEICSYVSYGQGVVSVLKNANPLSEAKFCACHT